MFHNWDFLLGEIWGLLFLAAVLGLLSGWLIWSRRDFDATEAASRELEELRALLASAEAREAGMDGEPVAEAASAEPEGSLSQPSGTPPPEGRTPATLTSPRNGLADDLQRIKGVDAPMETLLHGLGIYHFDQIANWDKQDVDWVDARLDGFQGSIRQDNWVKQAQLLSEGFEPKFAQGGEAADLYRN